jgi:hypothetical protein
MGVRSRRGVVRPGRHITRVAVGMGKSLHLGVPRGSAPASSTRSSGSRWYARSGATQESGRIFGYPQRPSGGERGLMRVVDAAFDWRLRPQWSVTTLVSRAADPWCATHSRPGRPSSSTCRRLGRIPPVPARPSAAV